MRIRMALNIYGGALLCNPLERVYQITSIPYDTDIDTVACICSLISALLELLSQAFVMSCHGGGDFGYTILGYICSWGMGHGTMRNRELLSLRPSYLIVGRYADSLAHLPPPPQNGQQLLASVFITRYTFHGFLS